MKKDTEDEKLRKEAVLRKFGFTEESEPEPIEARLNEVWVGILRTTARSISKEYPVGSRCTYFLPGGPIEGKPAIINAPFCVGEGKYPFDILACIDCEPLPVWCRYVVMEPA